VESLNGLFQKLETTLFALLVEDMTMARAQLLCKETLLLLKAKSYVWQLVNKAKVREVAEEAM
jgi:hypothetical protein